MIIGLLSFGILFITFSYISEKKAREEEIVKTIQLIKNIVDGKIDIKRIKTILEEYEGKK